jgi:hypothetical protein
MISAVAIPFAGRRSHADGTVVVVLIFVIFFVFVVIRAFAGFFFVFFFVRLGADFAFPLRGLRVVDVRSGRRHGVGSTRMGGFPAGNGPGFLRVGGNAFSAALYGASDRDNARSAFTGAFAAARGRLFRLAFLGFPDLRVDKYVVDVQKRGLFQADIDERGLHARKHASHSPFVDVSDDPLA